MSSQRDEHGNPTPKIIEDGPVMRSVAIMSPQAMAPLDSFQRLSLHSDKPLLHQKNQFDKGAIPPPINIIVKPNVESSPWRVVKAVSLPPNYQLDRSHVRISNSSTLEVSKRIADYFFKESFSVTYDNEKALAVAANSRCLKFHVRIWESLDVNIVEVQRYAGCGIEFQYTVKEILSMAKSGVVATCRTWSLPMPRSLPKLPDTVWEESTNEALDIACESLKRSDRIDSHSLAVESLEQLSCSQNCRLFCAKAILSADSEVLPLLLSLIRRTDLTSRQTSEDSDVGLDDCYRLLRRGAVNTLSNCLECVTSSIQLNSRVIDCLNDITLSALVHDIACAEINPHDAAASCRCVNLLCQCDDHLKQRLLELGVAGHVAIAANCRHNMLQQETKLLLTLL